MKKTLKVIGFAAVIVIGAILIWQFVLPFINFVLRYIVDFLMNIF